MESLMKFLEKNNIVYTPEQNTPKTDQLYEELPAPDSNNSSPVNNTTEVTMVEEPVTTSSPYSEIFLNDWLTMWKDWEEN